MGKFTETKNFKTFGKMAHPNLFAAIKRDATLKVTKTKPPTSKIRTKAELKYFKDDDGETQEQLQQNDVEESQTNDISFIISQPELEFVQCLGCEQQESLIEEFNVYLNN